MNEIEIKYIPPDKLIPYVNNAKKHKIAWIEKSIEEFDFDQPIVVDKNMVIIKGHGRHEAAKNLGIEMVPVIIRNDLNAYQAAMSRLADNRAQAGAGFDFSKLNTELSFLNKKYDSKFLNSVGFNETFLKKGAKEDLLIDLDRNDDGSQFNSEISEDNDQDLNQKGIQQVLKKRILSIVLDAADYQKWQEYKDKIKKKQDTAAFLKMLESAGQ